LTQLDRPYLITGPQAAYEYHRWLTPLENVATLQVYTEDVPIWRQVNGEGCQVFETPPTTAQVQAVKEGIILEAINVETVSVVPSEVIEKLRRRVDSVHTPPETTTYPAGRHRAIPFAYQPIAERWGLRLVLPRYVIGKVALDLQAQQG